MVLSNGLAPKGWEFNMPYEVTNAGRKAVLYDQLENHQCEDSYCPTIESIKMQLDEIEKDEQAKVDDAMDAIHHNHRP